MVKWMINVRWIKFFYFRSMAIDNIVYIILKFIPRNHWGTSICLGWFEGKPSPWYVVQFRLSGTIILKVDATLSEATDDAGGIKHLKPIFDKTVNAFRLSIQNCRGFAVLDKIGWSKYNFSSLGIWFWKESPYLWVSLETILSCLSQRDWEGVVGFFLE